MLIKGIKRIELLKEYKRLKISSAHTTKLALLTS